MCASWVGRGGGARRNGQCWTCLFDAGIGSCPRWWVSWMEACRDYKLAMCQRCWSLTPIIFPVDCCIFHSNTSVREAWPEAMAIGLVYQCQMVLFVVVCELGWPRWCCGGLVASSTGDGRGTYPCHVQLVAGLGIKAFLGWPAMVEP